MYNWFVAFISPKEGSLINDLSLQYQDYQPKRDCPAVAAAAYRAGQVPYMEYSAIKDRVNQVEMIRRSVEDIIC
jgi:hypothetical protein